MTELRQIAPRACLDHIKTALIPLADAHTAQQMAAYMKHRFSFLGVQAPARRRALRPVYKASVRQSQADLLALVDELWGQPEREYQNVACDLLTLAERRLTPEALPRLLGWVTSSPWWDTVDTLAAHPIGSLVMRNPLLKPEIDSLAEHPDFWLRRTAILHQLLWKDSTDRQRLFDCCLRNAADPEFFIRKAIGWALRQYARTDAAAVYAFVEQHRDILSPLSQREALKHL